MSLFTKILIAVFFLSFFGTVTVGMLSGEQQISAMASPWQVLFICFASVMVLSFGLLFCIYCSIVDQRLNTAPTEQTKPIEA